MNVATTCYRSTFELIKAWWARLYSWFMRTIKSLFLDLSASPVYASLTTYHSPLTKLFLTPSSKLMGSYPNNLLALSIFKPERFALITGSGKVSEVTVNIRLLSRLNSFATVNAIWYGETMSFPARWISPTKRFSIIACIALHISYT